jgi:hypothetical protein
MKMTKTKTKLQSQIRFIFGFVLLTAACPALYSQENEIRRVLLISIDGMHALDFANCSEGIITANGGEPYCPNLAQLSHAGVKYLQASSSKPSDSFPGLMAQITGGSPRSTGVFYDVSYDRALSPPTTTTPLGIPGSPGFCPSIKGTQVGYEEEIDINKLDLYAGGGINPNFLPRDPKNNCAPVFPHSYLRVNTIFEVVKASGGYTAWTDKHPAYEIVNGPSGQGVDDFFGPEINSSPVGIPQVPGCNPLPDQTAVDPNNDDYTTSFANIKCYDSLKVRAIINQIDGKTHDGSGIKPVPTVFGMNFQAVSVGQKLNQLSNGVTGGYMSARGTPSQALLGEIKFVDASIGKMVAELKHEGLYDSTLIIISAKHGQSPIDPHRLQRIPFDIPGGMAPSDILGGLGNGLPAGFQGSTPVAQADEDDISQLWLRDPSKSVLAVDQLEAHAAEAGIGEIFWGPSLRLMFNDPSTDSRTPNIIVSPNVGVVYTGKNKKLAEHGGFANDDTNVMLLVAHRGLSPGTITSPVETTQIAPTILKALGLDPNQLQAVQKEHTQLLPGLPFSP